MDIRLGSRVNCNDRGGGKIDSVIVDRRTDRLAEIVVRVGGPWGRLVMIPAHRLRPGSNGVLTLNCNKKTLRGFLPLMHAQYVDDDSYYAITLATETGETYYPVLSFRSGLARTLVSNLQRGEVRIRNREPVRAADGVVGSVTGISVDRDLRLFGVAVRTRRPSGVHSALIPVGTFDRDRSTERSVYLNLDTKSATELCANWALL